MRKKEFAARVWSKLVAFDKHHKLLAPGSRVLAAISGGPDSTVLAHWLSVQARRKDLTVELFHVNHGLRGREAQRDANSVKALGAKLGLATRIVRAPVKAVAAKRGLGLEDAGRRERYRLLSARARRGHFDVVATGHQLDDQAETVLLHLLRGTSIEGLAGIPVRRLLAAGVELVRPLLPLTRTDILAYAEIHDLPWREDRSNADPKFTRNWVRRKVLPMLESRAPGIKARLAGFAEKARLTLKPRR